MRSPLAPSRHAVAPSVAFRSPAWIWAFALLLAIASFAARGQDDLPGRVGRIAEFSGQLYLSPEDRATEWEEIGLNYPLTSGDNLWVSGEGRAEVDYGGGQFRLAGDTNLHVSRLDDRQLALFVAQGRLIVRVRVLDPGDATRVDTPNTQITLTRPGLYRIDVSPDRQQTWVVVREGEAVLALVNGAQQVLPGQTASVLGPEPASADVRNNISTDGFDTWSADRDRRYERGRSTAHVSQQMIGYSDLDEFGTWQTYPDYGSVWFPTTVAAGWAPYRDGYWANVGGWGHTWVDSAPWGFAPFHYGRWAWIGGRWGWCPGRFVARPVWAPALVGWYGGAGWGLSVSVGAPVYGWVPLGWGEPFNPWWGRCSHNCWTQYNRTVNVNVNVRPTAPPQRFHNATVPGALTAVSATTITGRRPVSANLVQVPASLASSAPVIAAAPAATPGLGSTPRARPGVGAVPRPASTFAPPSRGGVAGAGGELRSGRPPAGQQSATPSGGVPGAGVSGATTTRPESPRADAPTRPSPTPSGAPGAGTPPSGTARPGHAGSQTGTWVPQPRTGTAPAGAPPAGPASTSAPGQVRPEPAAPSSAQQRPREQSTGNRAGSSALPASSPSGAGAGAIPVPTPGRAASPTADTRTPPAAAGPQSQSWRSRDAQAPGSVGRTTAPAPGGAITAAPTPPATGRPQIESRSQIEGRSQTPQPRRQWEPLAPPGGQSSAGVGIPLPRSAQSTAPVPRPGAVPVPASGARPPQPPAPPAGAAGVPAGATQAPVPEPQSNARQSPPRGDGFGKSGRGADKTDFTPGNAPGSGPK